MCNFLLHALTVKHFLCQMQWRLHFPSCLFLCSVTSVCVCAVYNYRAWAGSGTAISIMLLPLVFTSRGYLLYRNDFSDTMMQCCRPCNSPVSFVWATSPSWANMIFWAREDIHGIHVFGDGLNSWCDLAKRHVRNVEPCPINSCGLSRLSWRANTIEIAGARDRLLGMSTTMASQSMLVANIGTCWYLCHILQRFAIEFKACWAVHSSYWRSG